MGLLKKIGRIVTGRDAETGERLSPVDHLKQLHSPSKSIFEGRQDRLKSEAEVAAQRQADEIDSQLAALRNAYNTPTPTNSLTAGLDPPGNEGNGGPPPKGGDGEALIGKKELIQIGTALVIGLITWKLGGGG